jgi:hypothetical protein
MSNENDLKKVEQESSEPKKKKQQIIYGLGEINTSVLEAHGLTKSENDSALTLAIRQATGDTKNNKKIVTPRLGFTEEPISSNQYAGVYKFKKRLTPDPVLKMMRTENHLIASILRARGNHLSSLAKLKKDRFDVGIEVDIRSEFKDLISPDRMVKVQDRIEKIKKILVNCGKTEGLPETEKMSLSEFFYLQTIDGLSLGRFSTEIVYDEGDNGDPNVLSDRAKKFNRFRPLDAGTIYKTVKKGEGAAGLRQSGIRLLEQLTGNKINGRAFEEDQYAYVQVIDGAPRQAFTYDECLVHNLFPSNDVDHNGYPVTPIDTCLNSATTHLSIDAYNKLYFQNGRASKGILVVKSEEIDQNTINGLKQEFMASINNVGNAFRVPVFGVGPEDQVDWLPVTSSAGDGEFQFLYDAVARNILSTFSMSPDELPGYGHLSRGSNQQSLSESSNEFKLTAARDTGLRPLIMQFQSFLNDKLFKIIDPELSQLCIISISGVDQESKEQEAVRLQQEMPIHMTYDDVLSEVDKEELGSRLAGSVPFNERWAVIADKYLNVGDIITELIKSPSAIVDPLLRYKRDPFYVQNLQLLIQINPSAVKAYYATKPYAMDLLKMMIQDYLEEDIDGSGANS